MKKILIKDLNIDILPESVKELINAVMPKYAYIVGPDKIRDIEVTKYRINVPKRLRSIITYGTYFEFFLQYEKTKL